MGRRPAIHLIRKREIVGIQPPKRKGISVSSANSNQIGRKKGSHEISGRDRNSTQ